MGHACSELVWGFYPRLIDVGIDKDSWVVLVRGVSLTVSPNILTTSLDIMQWQSVNPTVEIVDSVLTEVVFQILSGQE